MKQWFPIDFMHLLHIGLVGALAGILLSCSSSPQPSPQHSRYKLPPPIKTYPTPTKKPKKHMPAINQSREVTSADFDAWVNQYPWRRQQVAEYQSYLIENAGFSPPMEQMLRSARSWEVCGFEPFEIPPKQHWADMVPTLQLLNVFLENGYFTSTYRIVSVYRNPELNRCAKGSKGSKHLMNAALDIRIDYADEYERYSTEYQLCEFWNSQGDAHRFGLGLYQSGTIHIDTQGYRRWGSSHGSGSSPCS